MPTRWIVKSAALTLLVNLSACGGPEVLDPTCEQAANHLSACAGGIPQGFVAACTPDQGQEILELDCRTLASAGEVTADGWFGWFMDLAEGKHCAFNMQCAGDLVCRPESDGYWPGDPVCTSMASERQFCDSDADCRVGLACLGHTFMWENGRCLYPSGHSERHSVCASLVRHMNGCQIAAGETLLDSCLASTELPKIEELLDLSCQRLIALVEGGIDFDGDGFITDVGYDRRCIFNFQCSGDLVCRPSEKSFGVYNLADPEDKFCLPAGTECGYCDSTADCAGGLACLGYSVLGDNGRCLDPGDDQDYQRAACRTLRSRMISCGIATSRSLVASCLVTDRWDFVEELLDMSCQSLASAPIEL